MKSKRSNEEKMIIGAVMDAMKITEWFRREGFKIYEKLDKTPVTHADIASQILIISRIKEKFPEDMIIAEEDQQFMDDTSQNIIIQCFEELGFSHSIDLTATITHKGTDSRRQWTIDPIDGTKGFSHGLVYAIGVCFMEVNIPKMCTIGVPHYNDNKRVIFHAEERKGAKCSQNGSEFKHIHVNRQDDLKKIRMCHSLHYDEPWVVQFANKIGISEFIQIDSMAKLCMVSDGTADVYIKPIEKDNSFSWDFAPGYLLVKEAGGMITDLDGNDLHFDKENMKCKTPGLIASNGVIHDSLILELEKINFWK